MKVCEWTVVFSLNGPWSFLFARSSCSPPWHFNSFCYHVSEPISLQIISFAGQLFDYRLIDWLRQLKNKEFLFVRFERRRCFAICGRSHLPNRFTCGQRKCLIREQIDFNCRLSVGQPCCPWSRHCCPAPYCTTFSFNSCWLRRRAWPVVKCMETRAMNRFAVPLSASVYLLNLANVTKKVMSPVSKTASTVLTRSIMNVVRVSVSINQIFYRRRPFLLMIMCWLFSFRNVSQAESYGHCAQFDFARRRLAGTVFRTISGVDRWTRSFEKMDFPYISGSA